MATVGGIRIVAQANAGEFATQMSRMQRSVAAATGDMRKRFDTTAASVARLNAASNLRFNSFGFLSAGRALGDVNRQADLLRSTFLGLTAIAGGFSLALATNQVLEWADAYTTLQNRLKVVTNSEEELAAIEERLFDIAQRSRAGLKETAVLYSRLAVATKNLGHSQEDLLRITETIQKAFVVGGATVSEALNSAIQLSQGLASNRLGGDELRSVLENPALGQLLADQITAGDIGALRELAEQGKLTAKVIADAFLKASDEIDTAFARTVPTIRQAFVVLNNAFIKFIGEGDQASGASQLLAGALIKLADNIDLVAGAITVISGALLTRYIAKGIDPAIDKTKNFIQSLAASRAAMVTEAQSALQAANVRRQASLGEIAAIQQKINALELERAAYAQNIAIAQRQAVESRRIVEAQRANAAAGFGSMAISAQRYQTALKDTVQSERAALANQQRLAQTTRGLAAAQIELRAAYAAAGLATTAATSQQVAYNAALTATSTRAVMAATAMNALNSVMMAFGGPVGFAITAVATGLLLWSLRTDKASEALQQHEKLIGDVRIAYQDAGSSVDAFARKVSDSTRFAAEANFRNMTSQLQEASEDLVASLGGLRAAATGVTNPFAAFAEPLQEFLAGVRAGAPEVKKLLDEVAKIALANPELQATADVIFKNAESAAVFAEKAAIAEAAIAAMNGDAEAAKRILDGVGLAANSSADALDRLGNAVKSDATSFEEALKNLQKFDPEMAKVIEAEEEMAQALAEFSAGVRFLEEQGLPAWLMSSSSAMEALRAAFDRARESVGLTGRELERAKNSLERWIDAGLMAGMNEQEQAVYRLVRAYEEQRQQIEENKLGQDALNQAHQSFLQQLGAIEGAVGHTAPIVTEYTNLDGSIVNVTRHHQEMVKEMTGGLSGLSGFVQDLVAQFTNLGQAMSGLPDVTRHTPSGGGTPAVTGGGEVNGSGAGVVQPSVVRFDPTTGTFIRETASHTADTAQSSGVTAGATERTATSAAALESGQGEQTVLQSGILDISRMSHGELVGMRSDLDSFAQNIIAHNQAIANALAGGTTGGGSDAGGGATGFGSTIGQNIDAQDTTSLGFTNPFSSHFASIPIERFFVSLPDSPDDEDTTPAPSRPTQPPIVNINVNLPPDSGQSQRERARELARLVHQELNRSFS